MLDINPSLGMDILSGLNVFVGGSRTETDKEVGLSKGDTKDHEEVIVGSTFAYGPVTVGYQRSAEFTGQEVGTSVEYYQNNAFGVSFNISDDLSISYGEMESN